MGNIKDDNGLGSGIRDILLGIRDAGRDFKDRLSRERSIRLMAALGVVVLFIAFVVWEVEKGQATAADDPESWIQSIWDAAYWAIITGTTVGYGDKTPHTPLGRGLTIFLILSSMALTSVMTATIASWFVEKRILEGKGMEKITWRKHIVICGWNANARQLLEGIYRDTKDSAQVALVNNLPEEEISEILYLFRRQGLRFVRGDFVHESVLGRANVYNAASVIILADGSVNTGYAGSDQRTILSALAVKSMNPAVRVSAELVDEENVQHLRRAQVDHVVVMGEHDDFLLASSVTAPGVVLALQDLLNPQRGTLIQQARIPSQFVGQTFKELAAHFREKSGAMLIGLVRQDEQGVTLDDILSDDMSAIDRFIKTQFAGLEQDYFGKRASMRVRMNPPDDFNIEKTDRALVISGREDDRPHGGVG